MGFNGVATFSGKHNGVQSLLKRPHVTLYLYTATAIYFTLTAFKLPTTLKELSMWTQHLLLCGNFSTTHLTNRVSKGDAAQPWSARAEDHQAFRYPLAGSRGMRKGSERKLQCHLATSMRKHMSLKLWEIAKLSAKINNNSHLSSQYTFYPKWQS